MRVSGDKKRFLTALLLLCLVAILSVSPPDYHRRTPNQKRLDGTCDLSSDVLASFDHDDHRDDLLAFQTLLPPGTSQPVVLAHAGTVEPFHFVLPNSVSSLVQPGRAPPASL